MSENKKKNVLLVGGTGFLGPVLVEELALAGFQVICGVRNMEKAGRQIAFPGVILLKVDMNKDLDSDTWLARLKEHDIDVVVNNVGIVNSFGDQSLENVNVTAPMALFKAMQSYHGSQKSLQGEDVLRVIQISTTGVDWPDCHKIPYPASKQKLEEQLSSLKDLPHVIIRPNVVYEPERGNLLLEQIAKIPIIFYVGNELIQPIHNREVAIGTARLLMKKDPVKQAILRATGPVAMTWKQVFAMSSAALEKSQIAYCPVPLKAAQFVTMLIQKLPKKILHKFGILSKMDADTMYMMTRGTTASNKEWLRATGLQPIRLEDTYREYKKGTKAYDSYIQSIRDGSA